jgi:hypothetical protein
MLPAKPIERQGQLTLDDTSYDMQLNAWNFKRLLAQKYDVVVTNPPYMGGSGMSAKMSDYVKMNYPDSKSDLFAVFIEKCGDLLKLNGFQSMITMESWMFLSSFEKLRGKLFLTQTIINMVHMPYLGKGGTSLGINFGTAAFVIRKARIKDYAAQYDYIRYYETNDEGIPFEFPTINERYRASTTENFKKIPGYPLAYWKSHKIVESFSNGNLDAELTFRQGMTTTDNEKYLRFWHEVELAEIGFRIKSREQAVATEFRWFPYQKGGEYQKWYGNNNYVVYYYHDGQELIDLVTKKYPKISDPEFIIKNRNWYFKEGLTWSTLSTASFGARYCGGGYIFDAKGSMAFPNNATDIRYYIALLNSCVSAGYLDVLTPTMDFNIVGLKSVPYIVAKEYDVVEITNRCIAIAINDWDSTETSWDFTRHPLICGERTVAVAFAKWELEAQERFDTLKQNEEELNRIFIDIYGLHDELTPDVEEKDVTVRRADLGREIRSLISYAVGCMFGRYSLDVDGLAYAGGDWDAGKYKTFSADKDNILPICDDEYFDDDILGRFVNFIRVVYGAETLEENLKFIADALGSKGTPREVIRNYFLNDFYADHCKIYQKRPIYWLFDSGKKNGFKVLVYLHRYSRDLLAKLRTDYVHEQQERYRTQLLHIATALNTATGSERARLLKQQDKLSEQLKEITAFEEKVHHLADQNIEIDLDDGVKKNYGIFTDVLAKI